MAEQQQRLKALKEAHERESKEAEEKARREADAARRQERERRRKAEIELRQQLFEQAKVFPQDFRYEPDGDELARFRRPFQLPPDQIQLQCVQYS